MRGKYGLKLSPPGACKLNLAHYRTQLPAAPPSVRWDIHLAQPLTMLGNDEYGDCVPVALAHYVDSLRANTGKSAPPVTEAEALAAYSSITGFNPTTGAGDNGTDETSALNWFQSTGLYGTKAEAFAEFDPRDPHLMAESVYLFGGALLGLEVTASAEHQFDLGQPWTRPWFSPSRGLHGVPCLGYDTKGLYIYTWKTIALMTWPYWEAYGRESYAIVCREWLENSGVSPSGIDLQALLTDAQAMAA